MTTIEDLKHFGPAKTEEQILPDSKGVYIIVLRKSSRLPKVNCNYTFTKIYDKEVIYVGISNSSLRKRDFKQHFNGNAGSSTLRKSIGSLFGFKKISRSANKNDGKTKFNEIDELQISNWMKKNLEFYYLITADTKIIEENLINTLNPALNISKNYNKENSEFRNLLSKLRSEK